MNLVGSRWECSAAFVGRQTRSVSATACAFDTGEELLWTATDDGRLTSLFIDGHTNMATKHSSFVAHDRSQPVLHMQTVGDGILSASRRSVRFHTRGGQELSRFSKLDAALDASFNMPAYQHHIDRKPHFTAAQTMENGASMVLAATNSLHTSPALVSVDLNTQQVLQLVSVEQRVSCFSGLRNLLCSGTENGALEIRDPRAPQLRPQNAIAAHTGGVVDIDVKGNLVVTCGLTRSMGPGTGRPDTMIKVFDTRTMQPLPPAAFAPGPSRVRFVPKFSSLVAVISGNTGQLGYLDAELGSSNMTDMYQVATNAPFSCMAASPSGELLAIGDAAGGVRLWTDRQPAKVNLFSKPTQHASVFPVDFNIALDDDSFGTGWVVPDDQRLWDAAPTGFMLNDRLISAPLNVVKPTHHHKQHHNVPNWVLEAEHKPSTEFMPLSAWGSLCWTSLTTTAYRPLPPIDTSLIPDLKYRDNDYLGIAKNPGGGFVRNNMNSLRRFAVVQRKSLSAEKSGANKGIGAVRHTPRTPAELEAYRAFYAHVTAPADTRDFDPRAFNATRLVGLDNSLPNAFANAALQVLYFVPAFRQHMMNHLCERESCLSCELGFLFHILDKSSSPMAQARNFLRILRQIPEATALALLEGPANEPAVFESSVGQRIQSFTRFLLEQLHKENTLQMAIANEAPSPNSRNTPPISLGSHHRADGQSLIEVLFGWQQDAVTKCLGGSHDTHRKVQSYHVQLSYPEKREFVSFENVVSKSLAASNTTRVWCETCATYQACHHTRRPKSLPNLLVIHANLQNDSDLELWRSHRRDEQWVSARLRIAVDKNGVPTATRVPLDAPTAPNALSFPDLESSPAGGASSAADYKLPMPGQQVSQSHEISAEYYLTAVIAQVNDELMDGDREHLVAHCLVPSHHVQRQAAATPDPRHPDATFQVGEGSWFVFNDFAVTESTLTEAINFQHAFKTPCLLFYSRADLHRQVPVPPPVAPISQLMFAEKQLSVQRRQSSSRPRALANLHSLARGALVALDAEFVCVEREESEISESGRRIVTKPPRHVLARVSVLRGDREEVIMDDYIKTSEPVVDYLTKYSGIQPGDLDVAVSPHNLVTLKSAYIRLRALVDQGVVFVGHGLKKDFQMSNLVVPASQIQDTVEIYHLPNQRFMSLKFLATHVLGLSVQTENHDSIEDARTALSLYQRALQLQAEGQFDTVLNELYAIGHSFNWK